MDVLPMIITLTLLAALGCIVLGLCHALSIRCSSCRKWVPPWFRRCPFCEKALHSRENAGVLRGSGNVHNDQTSPSLFEAPTHKLPMRKRDGA